MISIIIIGKNESENLPSLFASLDTIMITKETIYVDSASTDDSVNIADKYCDKVCVIEPHEQNSASAGRYVGTLESQYKWILYLDGDMVLKDEFIDFLNSKVFLEEEHCGYIGYYRYIYADRSIRENVMLQAKNRDVKHFGGAVFLKRDIVLESGNWNPSIIGNEEIDLYARMQKKGCKVYGSDVEMVDHLAKKISNFDTLKSLFFPLNKRFFGFGQVLASQFKSNNLWFFMKIHPYPFIMLLSIVFLSFGVWYPFALTLIYISIKKRYYYNVLYISDVIKGIFGLITYKNYIPKYKIISSKMNKI